MRVYKMYPNKKISDGKPDVVLNVDGRKAVSRCRKKISQATIASVWEHGDKPSVPYKNTGFLHQVIKRQ
jgi:hypothetical protein